MILWEVEPVFKSSKISKFSLQSPPHWHKAELLSHTCTVLCTLFCSCSIVAPWVNCQPQAEFVYKGFQLFIRAGMISYQYIDLSLLQYIKILRALERCGLGTRLRTSSCFARIIISCCIPSFLHVMMETVLAITLLWISICAFSVEGKWTRMQLAFIGGRGNWC